MKNHPITLLICIILLIPITSGVTIEQQSRGDILYVGGYGPGNYTTIQDAIDNATKGDTVFVFNESAPYYEDLLVNKTINLVGENRDSTILNGYIGIRNDYVNLSGFTITFGGVGISCTGANHCTITDNIITRNVFIGIKLDEATNNTISHNLILNNSGAFIQGGIYLQYGSHYNTIHNNMIMGHESGIYVDDGYFNKIFENTFKNNWGYSIRIFDFLNVSDNQFFHNNFCDIVYDPNPTNLWDDGEPAGGNYWDWRYEGLDSDGDGVGDTPYRIHGSDSYDNYPLMLPYGDSTGVHIVTPEMNFLYFLNQSVRFMGNTLIVGPIKILAYAANYIHGVESVEFYIDNSLMSIDDSPPYTWWWLRPSILPHMLRVYAYGNNGDVISDELLVWKIF